MTLTVILSVIAGLAVGVLIGLCTRKRSSKEIQGSSFRIGEDHLRSSQKAEQMKRDIVSEGKEEIHRLRQELDRDTKERRNELQRSERRLEQKEENLDRKIESISRKEEELVQKHEQVQEKLNQLSAKEQELISNLEQIAQLTREQARDLLLTEVESEANHLIGLRLKELEERAKREADRKAQEIIATAVQRCSVEFTSDAVVSVVNLPSDEMKGRIIGREGRNIRTLRPLRAWT